MEKFKPIFGYKTKNYYSTKVLLRGSTQIFTFKTAINSNRIRILLTNKFNHKKLRVSKMTLTVDNIKYNVTLNGKKRFHLKADSEVYSDEIVMYENIYDSITLTSKFTWFAKAYSASDFNSTIIAKVDHVNLFNKKINLGLTTKAINKPDLQILVLIKQVEAMSDKIKNITWFGDSLTNHGHYTQALQKRLIDNNLLITILNAGQSGNRLLKDGRLLFKDIFGVSALKRIDEDVFKYDLPDLVVVAVGINDLIHPASTVSALEMPETSEMIEGYLELLKIIKSYKSLAAIATITPFNGYKVSTLLKAEHCRQEINKWIRSQTDFDLIIDLDEIVRDPKDSSWLQPVFRGDDNLHFLKEGGQIIADKINLETLTGILLNK